MCVLIVAPRERRKTDGRTPTARTGRKGPFAFYYLQIAVRFVLLPFFVTSLTSLSSRQPKSKAYPRGGSLLAAGYWGPSSENTKALREQIVADSGPLRKILKEKTFCKYFGDFDPTTKTRQNVFGAEDALKKAPKMEGVTKDHPEIDLLKWVVQLGVRLPAFGSRLTSPSHTQAEVHRCVASLL